MRSHDRRRRTRTRTAVSVAAMAAGTFAVAACSTGSPKPLPDSDHEVSSDAPLTAEQATSVRSAGRKLMLDYLDRLPLTADGVDTDRSTERWDDCTARQKSFSFHPTLNGVLYKATVFVGTTQTLTVEQIHAAFQDTGTTWDTDDGERGQRGKQGVFGVRLNTRAQPLVITVTSPCYYLRDADGLSADEIEKVGGFVSREWDE